MTFRRRIIFLGASNLTLGLPLLVDLVRQNCEAPIDVYSAHGLGRSYGMSSNLFGRGLPGILESELWSTLSKQTPLPTTALVTDIGNDILYNVPPERIAEWVDESIVRLEGLGAQVSMTLLPVCNLEHLGRLRFYTLRTSFFPTCRLSYERVVERAEQVNRLIAQIGESRDIRTVAPPVDWYGFDAIHIKPYCWHTAWPAILAPMFCHIRGEESGVASSKTAGLARAGLDMARSAWWMLTPADRRWLLGIEQRQRQPALRLDDGTAVSFY